MAFQEDAKPFIGGGVVTPFGDGFDIAPETESPFELYGPTPKPLPDSVANHRADKYDYALGQDSPGKDQLRHEILSGDEDYTREHIVQRRRIADEQLKVQLAREYIQKAGPQASKEDIDLIMSSTPEELSDPSTFYEKAYAKKFFQDASTLDYEPTDVGGVVIDDSILSEAMEQDPDAALGILEAGERIKANRELDLKLLEDAEADIKQSSWTSAILDTTEQFLPFFTWYNLTNLTPESEGFLLGNNLEKTYENLNLMPVDERARETRRIYESIKEVNQYDALMFVRGLLEYTGTDKFFNNALSVIDSTLPLPVVGSVPARAYTGAVARLSNLTKSALKASSQRATDPVAVAAATGDTVRAAHVQALQEIGEMAAATTGSTGAKSYVNFLSKVTSLADPASITRDIGKTSREYAHRLVDTMADNATQLFRSTFQDVLQSNRLDAVAHVAASTEVRRLMNMTYKGSGDVVIDIAPAVPSDGAFYNANYLKVTLGNKDGNLFESAEQAINVNRNFYGFVGAKVNSVGGKYGLQVFVPVPEESIAVRDALIKTTQGATAHSIGTLLTEYTWGGLRSGKDVTSKKLAQELDAAIIGGSKLAELAKQVYAPLGKLSKQESSDFSRVMNHQRWYKEQGQTTPGKYSNTLAELDSDYLKVTGRLPTDKERDAYWATVQLSDWGWVLTNSGLFRDKSRKGLELFGFGRGATKPSVEGKIVTADDIWKNTEDAGVVVMDDTDPSSFTHFYRNWLRGSTDEAGDELTKADFVRMLESGEYKIVQLSEVGERAFKEMFKDSDQTLGSVNFVVAKNVRRSPLEFEQIPYRPGGHVEIDPNTIFISQANIQRISRPNRSPKTIYYGDKNAYAFVSEGNAKTVLGNLEKARQLLHTASTTKDAAERVVAVTQLKEFLRSKAGLPHTFKEFVRMFKGKEAVFRLDEPFHLRNRNETLEGRYALSQDQVRNPNWINKKDSAYNLYKGGLNLEWAGERGDHLFSIVNDGDMVNPVWNYRPARYVDPLITHQRAAASAARDRVLDEFKITAAERYIAEFGKYLKAPIEEQRANPFKALLDGEFKTPGKGNTQDALAIAAAKATRRTVMEFLSNKTALGRHMDVVKANLFNKLVGDRGEIATRNILDRLEGWSMSKIKDPVQFMRSMAFHQKLGLFNPVQLFLQAQTVTHVIGVAGPVNGWKGFEAAMAQRWAMVSPRHVDYIAKKLPGWKADEFKESFEWAQKSGWYRIGREVAVQSDYLDEAMVQGFGSKILEKGKWFFNEGERIVRMAAWNAAYLEWKQANPGKALNGAAAKNILNRADLLSVNMTAASNASWQRGVIGIPTQFFAYQARLAEQFLGKRLTPQEKARAFATYSVVYGIPVAMGAPTALWPMHETIKEWALQNGYEPEGPLRFLDEGLMSVIVESLAGEQYNVSERYGPGGLPFIEDIISGDTTILEALGGVSGTSIADNLKASAPFVYALANLFNPMSDAYPLTTQDFIDLGRTVNSVNQAYNFMTAVNLGKLYSKTGNTTDEMGVLNGILNGLFGLTPSRISDGYRILENENERREFQKKGVKEVTKELRKALDPNVSEEDRMTHMKRVHGLAHGVYALDSRQLRQVMKDAMSGSTTIYNITRNAARNSKPYLDYFEKQQRLRQEQLR